MELSVYELDCLQRLKKSKEMLERLGLTGSKARDLKEQISGVPVKEVPKKADASAPKKPKERAQRPVLEPTRRSGRNAGKLPIKYCDVDDLEEQPKKFAKEKQDPLSQAVPEIYTVAQLNALGTCQMTYYEHPDRLPENTPKNKAKYKAKGWFAGKSHMMGKYIKDYSGATLDKHGNGQRVGCHWCRQCTRDAKARCACGTWMCGPCLQGRYGENLFEIICSPADSWTPADPMMNAQKPEWRCPVCRDICNCSGSSCLRKKNGWASTGELAKQAENQGYDSAAHYLIMGQFDATVVELDLALAKGDTGELQTILAKVKYMGLDDAQPDPNIKQRFCGDDEGDKSTLFYFGCTAAQVITQLRDLVARAHAALLAAPEGEAVDSERLSGSKREAADAAEFPLAKRAVGPCVELQPIR